MGNVVVHGASFSIIVDSPVVSPGVPSTTLSVSSSSKLQGDSKNVALKSDMEGQAEIPGIAYINPPYTIPGVLKWDGIFSDSQESTKLKKDGSFVIVDDTISGSANFDVVTPANDPNPPVGPPIPDSSTSYPGTWSMSSAGQSKLTTTE